MLRRAGETAKVIEGEAIDVTPPPVRKSQVLSRSLPLVQVSASYVHACRSGQSRPAPPRPLRYGHTSFVNAWLLAALCGSLEGRLSPLASAGGWPSSFLRSAARRSGTGSRTAVYSAASTRPI